MNLTAEQLHFASGILWAGLILQVLLYYILSLTLNDRLLALFKAGQLNEPTAPKVIVIGHRGSLRAFGYLMRLGPGACPDSVAVTLARRIRLLLLTMPLTVAVFVWVDAGAPSISLPPPDQPDDVRARAS